MLVFISCAKTMAARCSVVVPEVTVPKFETEAVRNALEMSQYSVSELERLLRVNTKIAAENRLRFHDFCSEDFRYAQEHLRITSFLYGLLRPLDGIKPYRLEGDVRLPEKGGISMFDYWKPLLTDYFIEEIKNCGGVLINLASAEMKDLFDWKRVEQEVRVITPEFQVWKAGQPKTVVIYAKMCRGEMTRFIVKNRLECPEELKSFSWEGFVWDEIRSTENVWHFSLGTFM